MLQLYGKLVNYVIDFLTQSTQLHMCCEAIAASTYV
jgi:hypothetical protein